MDNYPAGMTDRQLGVDPPPVDEDDLCEQVCDRFHEILDHCKGVYYDEFCECDTEPNDSGQYKATFKVFAYVDYAPPDNKPDGEEY